MSFDDNANPFERRSSRSFTFGRQTPPGFGIEGTIESIGKPFHQTKYNQDKSAPRVLDYWPSGDPKMAVPITLQTSLNEPNEDYPVDDGMRSLIIDMEYKQDGKMNAIQEAVKAAGGRVPEPGGYLGLWFVDLDPESKNPDQPRKRFRASYRLPVGAGAAAFGGAPAAAPPIQQVQPPQQPTYTQPLQLQPQAQPVYGGAAAQPPYGQPSQPQREQQVQQAQNQFPNAQFSQQAPPPAYPAPVPAPAQPDINPDWIRSLLNEGRTDADIMQATGYPLDAISAVRNVSNLS